MSELPDPRFLDDRLAYWAETKPEAEALTYLDRTWTWAELNDRVRRLAGALKERGIKRGDVVAFLDKNHPACVELTVAAASLGAANAIINFRLAGDELDYVLNDSGAKVLIVGKELKPTIDKIRDELPNVEHIIEVTPEGGDDDEYEAMLAAATPVGRGDDVEPDDVCIIMYSSGTTGRPKGVAAHPGQPDRAHGQRLTRVGNSTRATRTWSRCRCSTSAGSSYVQFGLHDGMPERHDARRRRRLAGGRESCKGANRTFLVPAVLAKVLESGPDAVKLFGALKTYAYGASPMPLAAPAPGAGGVAEHRLHPGVRADRGVRCDQPTCMPEEHRADNEERLSARAPWSRAPRCGSSTPTLLRTCRPASRANYGSAQRN